VASVLARWFDDIIKDEKIKPTLDGKYIFDVKRRALEKNTANGKVTATLRKHLKKYGYSLSLRKSSVIITKFR
jgi:hypothetical protein